MIKPVNFNPNQKYPVYVTIYGGPGHNEVSDSWDGNDYLYHQLLAQKGYIVVSVDPRGTMYRGAAFKKSTYLQLGKLETEDFINTAKELQKLPYVDPNRIGIQGWSFGGFMTTSMMLRNPGVYKVGVAGGPVTDWKFYETMYGERYMDMPEENPEGYKTSSLLNYAQNLKGDLLLIHGTNDDVVVMQHNFALIKKFVELGVQMDFFPYPMHKHNVQGKDRVHLMKKVLDYVIDNNK
jgi:dipeptidyl-peptidase-4